MYGAPPTDPRDYNFTAGPAEPWKPSQFPEDDLVKCAEQAESEYKAQ